MGRIKCSLCFKEKQAKKSNFVPEIALRVECSDPVRNPYFQCPLPVQPAFPQLWKVFTVKWASPGLELLEK